MKINTLEIKGRKFLMTAEFHPIITLSGKKILRYQAVAQFYNGEDFLIPAEQTGVLLEETAVNRKVTDFIFEVICHVLKMKETMTVSFILSPQLINDMDYLTQLIERCQHNDIAPQRIEIEVSNHLTYSQFISKLPALKQAREYGFMVSLGNFGCGNEHAERLQLFAFNTIKIDRSLVDGIARHPAKLSTLHRFIDSVIPAGTDVICEGVDSTADLALLNRYNAGGIQGYTFSRPLTFKQLQLLEGF